LPEIVLLSRKKYVEIIADFRTSYGTDFNFDARKSDKLYTIKENVLELIEKYKDEISPVWKKLHFNKKLDKYQVKL